MFKVSIFKRSGHRIYQMQARDPRDPKRKIRKSSGCTKAKDAERAAQRWEDELNEGRHRSGKRLTWVAFCELYHDRVVSGLASSTSRKVDAVMSVAGELLHLRMLSDLPARIVDYPSAMRKAGRTESTIKSHLGHLRAAMAWAVNARLLVSVPEMPAVQRAKKSGSGMRGRPLTGEEFERLLAATEKVIRHPNRGRAKKPSTPDLERIPSWQHLLRGLWWGGLRLSEALDLHWEDERRILVVLDGKFPMLRIRAEHEKGNRDRTLPLAREFAQILLETPLTSARALCSILSP